MTQNWHFVKKKCPMISASKSCYLKEFVIDPDRYFFCKVVIWLDNSLCKMVIEKEPILWKVVIWRNSIVWKEVIKCPPIFFLYVIWWDSNFVGKWWNPSCYSPERSSFFKVISWQNDWVGHIFRKMVIWRRLFDGILFS